MGSGTAVGVGGRDVGGTGTPESLTRSVHGLSLTLAGPRSAWTQRCPSWDWTSSINGAYLRLPPVPALSLQMKERRRAGRGPQHIPTEAEKQPEVGGGGACTRSPEITASP